MENKKLSHLNFAMVSFRYTTERTQYKIS